MVSQSDLVKRTKLERPSQNYQNQNGHVKIDFSKLTTNQVRYLSFLGHFLLMFLVNKAMNSYSVMNFIFHLYFILILYSKIYLY